MKNTKNTISKYLQHPMPGGCHLTAFETLKRSGSTGKLISGMLTMEAPNGVHYTIHHYWNIVNGELVDAHERLYGISGFKPIRYSENFSATITQVMQQRIFLKTVKRLKALYNDNAKALESMYSTNDLEAKGIAFERLAYIIQPAVKETINRAEAIDRAI